VLCSTKLKDLFRQLTSQIKTETRELGPYIEGVLSQYIHAQDDYSKDSVTLRFIQAQAQMNFAGYQKLGDWIFFLSSVFPEAAQQHKTVYSMIGQSCYKKCFILLNKEWVLYEELADNFVPLSNQIAEQFSKLD